MTKKNHIKPKKEKAVKEKAYFFRIDGNSVYQIDKETDTVIQKYMIINNHVRGSENESPFSCNLVQDEITYIMNTEILDTENAIICIYCKEKFSIRVDMMNKQEFKEAEYDGDMNEYIASFDCDNNAQFTLEIEAVC